MTTTSDISPAPSGTGTVHDPDAHRPAGMRQLRGSFLPSWEGLLPRVPEEQRRPAHRHPANALAADGGKAYAK